MSLAICVIEQVGAGFQYVLDTRVSKSPLSWNVHSVQLSGLADSEQTPPRDIVSLGATKGDSTGNFQQEPGNANARQRMTYADGQHAGAERQGFEPWVPLRGLRFSRPVRSAALPSLRSGCYGDPRVVSTTTHREQTQWSCTGSNLRKNQAARRCGSGATVGNAIVEWRPRAFLSPSTTRSRWLEGSSV